MLVGAQFLLGAVAPAQLPVDGAPEIAFAGRSNSGKSSAINALAQRTRLAFSSRTPGRTREINFFALRNGALVADLPGYGYAAVSRSVKEGWQSFLWDYVTTRNALVGLVLVTDARHGLKDSDRVLLTHYLPSGRPLLLLATKIDKLTQSERKRALSALEGAVAADFPGLAHQVSVVGFSALRHLGIEAADDVLAGWLGAQP